MTKNIEELVKKKKERKTAIYFILFLAISFLLIWFALDALATEKPVSQTQLFIGGKVRILKLSEKVRGYRNKNSSGEIESGTSHYGYFLELVDSLKKISLHKLKFKAPVRVIQEKPKIYISSHGIIWLVSTTDGFRDDEPGFILKFSTKNDSIQKFDYKLDEFYSIRKIEGNRVMLNKPNEFFQACNPISGCIYFDLETEKIVDTREKK
jgi:hypothetical protein